MATYFVLGSAPAAKPKKKTAAQRDRERKRCEKNMADLLNQNPEVGGQRPGTWPMVSMNLGVHPTQVAEANAKLKAAGIGAYHLRNGKLHIPDNGVRKQVLKFRQRRDRSAFS